MQVLFSPAAYDFCVPLPQGSLAQHLLLIVANGRKGIEASQMKVSADTATVHTPGSSSATNPAAGRPSDKFDLLPWLPCTLALDIPVVKFTLADLLHLRPGDIVETAYHQSSDLPLRVNGQLVGWTEFEVVGERLAVRLTDLS